MLAAAETVSETVDALPGTDGSSDDAQPVPAVPGDGSQESGVVPPVNLAESPAKVESPDDPEVSPDASEPPAVPVLEAPPEAIPEPHGPPPPRPMKRRRNLSEQDLRKQLASAPEIRSFTLDSMGTLVRAYKEGFYVSRGDWNGALEPSLLVQQRPDLAQLPVRSGSSCRLNRRAAAILESLSKKLRAYVETAVNRDTKDGRPDPSRLREVLHQERRGKRPEWLRPEAVPVLLQLLMHEDTPIREVLVEVLAAIDGPAATKALAQRAVFDLAPEVRQAAVSALGGRPLRDSRPVFLQAVRYPWAPAADHAAEALVALEDRGAVAQLVTLLKKPDPAAPTPVTGSWPVVREVVRINHRFNCLMCHPPAVRGGDPVPGMVPGVSLQLPESSFRMLAMCKETGRVVVNPLMVRADVTFMRQDFSVRQRVAPTGTLAAENLRFDYLVRKRPVNAQELARPKAPADAPYEQREAVLFALRELTGQDPGATPEAWLQLFPQAQQDAEAERLAAALLKAPATQKARLVDQYKLAKGGVYTQALAVASSQLRAPFQERARAALTDRLVRGLETLEPLLGQEDAEIRRAAARACGLTGAADLTPTLIRLLEDPEPPVAEAAYQALKKLTGQDFGTPTGDDRPGVLAAWNKWQEEQEAR